MGNVLFLDSNGESVHSYCEDKGIPEQGDIITIEGNRYTVKAVEKVIKNCNVSYRVHLT